MEAGTGLDHAAHVEPHMVEWARRLDAQAFALTAEVHRFASAQFKRILDERPGRPRAPEPEQSRSERR